MKKIVIVCGLIAGLICSGIMLYSMSICYANQDFDNGMIYGFGSMILAFSLIFVGVKVFRDKYNKGEVTFGKAFLIGSYISLIASTMYVIAWMIDYQYFIPDFMEKYTALELGKLKADGATDAELVKKTKEMADMTESYKNPLFRIMFTYLEILPVGILISLFSAAILKRKNKNSELAID